METQIIITLRDNPQAKDINKFAEKLKEVVLDFGLIGTVEISE